jgi:heme/copper-type cytochrome/quinol oxidase subunit 2
MNTKKIALWLFSIGFLLLGNSAAWAIAAVADCPDGGAGYTLVKGVCVPSAAATGLSAAEPGTIIIGVINWLMGIVGLIAMLVFVVSGWMYLTAAGDEKKTEEAKNNIKYAITGVVVALVAYVAVSLVANLMGVSTGVGASY